jgi:hypothetical protein
MNNYLSSRPNELRVLGPAPRSASGLAGSGRARVIRLSSDLGVALLRLRSCVLAMLAPRTSQLRTYSSTDSEGERQWLEQ